MVPKKTGVAAQRITAQTRNETISMVRLMV